MFILNAFYYNNYTLYEQKEIVSQLRHADEISARTQPQPNVPGGPYHKTSKIYYFTHDARREVEPPIEISVDKQITAG